MVGESFIDSNEDVSDGRLSRNSSAVGNSFVGIGGENMMTSGSARRTIDTSRFKYYSAIKTGFSHMENSEADDLDEYL